MSICVCVCVCYRCQLSLPVPTVRSQLTVPHGRLVKGCGAAAVQSPAPGGAPSAVHRPQLLPSHGYQGVPPLPSPRRPAGKGGRSKEGPVLPQQPPGRAGLGRSSGKVLESFLNLTDFFCTNMWAYFCCCLI